MHLVSFIYHTQCTFFLLSQKLVKSWNQKCRLDAIVVIKLLLHYAMKSITIQLYFYFTDLCYKINNIHKIMKNRYLYKLGNC